MSVEAARGLEALERRQPLLARRQWRADILALLQLYPPSASRLAYLRISPAPSHDRCTC